MIRLCELDANVINFQYHLPRQISHSGFPRLGEQGRGHTGTTGLLADSCFSKENISADRVVLSLSIISK